MNQVTMVTAFFDIGREKNGDGRSIAEYLQWIRHTLQLNCNLYVVTEEKFRDFFELGRPKGYPMHIEVIRFEDSHYYKFYGRIEEILQSKEYKSRKYTKTVSFSISAAIFGVKFRQIYCREATRP